jgi:hypothetical protein
MSTNGDILQEDTPTPKPWEDQELSVREALRRLGSHVIARLDEQDTRSNDRHENLTRGLKLELGSMKDAIVAQSRAITQLAEREQVTGSYLIQVAGMAGEAKGAAHAAASQRKSLPPLLRAVNWVGGLLADHWMLKAALLVAGALAGWLLHKPH